MIGAVLMPLVLSATPVAPELMERLAAHDQRMQEVEARTAVVVSSEVEEMDKDYQAVGKFASTVRVQVVDGRRHARVLRASKDGKDVTDEEQQKAAKKETERGKEGKGSKLESPFGASERGKYAFDNLGPEPGSSLWRIAYGPKDEPSTEVWIGEALVDPLAGELRSLFGRLSKLPTMVDSMSMQISYDATFEGTRMPSKITFAGEGGFLLVKKRVRGTTVLSYQPKDGSKQPP